MIVEAMAIQNWNQFQSIEFQFHPRMTVIVGENGSGKTTILQIIKQLFIQCQDIKKDSFENKETIGNITLVGNSKILISSSNHSLCPYPSVNIHVPTMHQLLQGRYIPSRECQLSHLDKELDLLKTDPDLLEAFNIVLGELFPKWFGFSSMKIEEDSIVLITKSGLIDINSLSSGINYLICLSWHIFHMQYGREGPFLFLIDELEAHLHASLQRNILQKLVKTFPQFQFIVSTHSPLIVHSVKDTAIFALTYDEKLRVTSRKIDFVQENISVTAILRDVLGVTATYPIWVEEELTQITNRYRGKELNNNVYKALKEDLQKSGLISIFPQIVNHLYGGEQS
ncbi:AAA family ATPase [Metabacillus sp. RGM 3146]|uniref:AAA family ATPase n=1 Tax=Metabacillus sp. RGM 3146 TaxID=3401092 RepID=UPI003B9986EE